MHDAQIRLVATKSMILPQLILSFVALTIIQLRHHGWVKGNYQAQNLINLLDRCSDNNYIIGVMISPPGVAPVCNGDQLELTCTMPGSFVEWSFFLIPEGETTARGYVRTLHSSDSFPASSDLEVNSITFIFSRISAAGSLPLLSRLAIVINPVNDGLNGIEVKCIDVLASNSTSTGIKIINESILISSKYYDIVWLSMTSRPILPFLRLRIDFMWNIEYGSADGIAEHENSYLYSYLYPTNNVDHGDQASAALFP